METAEDVESGVDALEGAKGKDRDFRGVFGVSQRDAGGTFCVGSPQEGRTVDTERQAAPREAQREEGSIPGFPEGESRGVSQMRTCVHAVKASSRGKHGGGNVPGT